MKGAKVLIIGLDGATWDVIDPMIERGELPTLSTLKNQGAWAPLESTNPPMTLPSWSSMLTGCNPGKHGIFDFMHCHNWQLEFINSTHRLVPTIHQVISMRGGRVASVAVPTTWPPAAVNGVMISGFDSPVSTGIDESFCYPKDLYQEITRRFGGLHFADFQESRIDADWHSQALDKLLLEIARKEQIAKWLLQQERWDCFMLLFGESDTVSHHFWMFHDPDSPRYQPQASQKLKGAIESVYKRLDQAVGELIEQADVEVVCICSDHGFGGAGEHILYLNRFLQQHGWLQYRRTQRLARRLDRFKIKAASHLPAAWQGRMFRRLPKMIRNQLETQSRFGGIDFSRTQAVSDERNYAATLRLNIPLDDVPKRKELEELLLSWTVDGQQPIEKIWFRDELYWGEAVERSPELIFRLRYRDGYSYTLLPSPASGNSWRKLQPEEYVGGKGAGMNGSHRQFGVLSLWGKDIKATPLQAANMTDITPTLLHVLGEKIPAHMDGRVLDEGIVSTETPTYSTASHEHDGDTIALNSQQTAALRQKLERLGYL